MSEINWLAIAKAVHFVGGIFWIGGIAGAGVALATKQVEDVRVVAGAVRHSILRVATPGMVLAWIGGLAVLIPNFTSTYAKAGWMHTKLLLVVVAAGLSGVLSGKLRRIVNGSADAKIGPTIPWTLGALGVIVVILATLRPF